LLSASLTSATRVEEAGNQPSSDWHKRSCVPVQSARRETGARGQPERRQQSVPRPRQNRRAGFLRSPLNLRLCIRQSHLSGPTGWFPPPTPVRLRSHSPGPRRQASLWRLQSTARVRAPHLSSTRDLFGRWLRQTQRWTSPMPGSQGWREYVPSLHPMDSELRTHLGHGEVRGKQPVVRKNGRRR
jgi:hypothetical protein